MKMNNENIERKNVLADITIPVSELNTESWSGIGDGSYFKNDMIKFFPEKKKE